eukprot:2234285-Ditylum_brightwellii.AAC.1
MGKSTSQVLHKITVGICIINGTYPIRGCVMAHGRWWSDWKFGYYGWVVAMDTTILWKGRGHSEGNPEMVESL